MNVLVSHSRIFPRLGYGLLTLVLLAVFIRLGLWQLHKAESKQALQAQLDRHLAEPPVALPERIDDPAAWRYRNVRIRGTYDTRYQILLDNQVAQDRAGFHVLTPLRLENSERHILVNRGWIPALPQHSVVPPVMTPTESVEIVGNLWLPPEKIYALARPAQTQSWELVWQNLDMQRYLQAVPFEVYPLVVRLDPHSQGGGFARDWLRPAERIETHLGYAYQWFGFAAAAVAIYLFLNFRKAPQ